LIGLRRIRPTIESNDIILRARRYNSSMVAIGVTVSRMIRAGADAKHGAWAAV
jgi:hypothetical protein